MKTTTLLAVTAMLLPGAIRVAGGAESAASKRPPNFIIFFTDDLGYNDVGCFGSPLIETPRLDRMAREGMKLTDFYVQPVCGVSRAALMTGCYPIRVAEPGNTKSGHPILHPKEITIAEVLKTRGYATALVGKWHLAGPGRRGLGPFKPELMPNAQGFDYFYGTPLHNGFTRTVQPGFTCVLMRNGRVLESPTDMDLLTQRYTKEAVRFITENKDRPFFLYLAHNMPHVPLGASKAFRGKSRRGLYGDVVQELDWSAGQVLDTLKELGIDDNTLMVFTSDNGPWIEAHLAGRGGIDAYYGSADPLRGSKMMTWDGGTRTPCIVRWPGKIPAGAVCREVVASMDLFPTFAKLAGAKLPDDRVIDGRDVSPLLMGRPGATSPHEVFYYYCFTHLQAVRQGKWKLVLPRPARPPWTLWSARMVDAVEKTELYDMEKDIGEKHDVAGENPEVVARLMELVEKARDDLGDYNRVGRGARFFDPGPRRPDAARWRRVEPAKNADGGGPYPKDFGYSTAIAAEKGVSRRDPSDVIKAGGKYYVWYSKVCKGPDVWGYPSGYSADVWYATSTDGRTWTEQGEAVGKGGAGAWDEHGVFTPNILAAEGKYYLFYTGVPKPFDADTKTAIGVAVADAPDGPWRKFDGNPVLRPSADAAKFDSMRVDDACLIVRDGRYWLYYKGRRISRSPAQTKMGVAIAENPTGPYVKHAAGPLHAGHEVLVWPHGEGVASMATAAGPKAIYFAKDGVRFELRNAVAHPPQAPGGFREDGFTAGAIGKGLRWGISHAAAGGDLFLRRFDCRFVTYARAAPVSSGPPPEAIYARGEPVGPLRFDFETGDLQGWRMVEGSFEALVNDRPRFHHAYNRAKYNKQGKYFLTTLERSGGGKGNDAQTGVVESPEFTLTGEKISLLVGGGSHAGTYVALCDAESGEQLLTARGRDSEVMQRVTWDAGKYRGRRLRLRVVDRHTGGWGHVTLDDVSIQGEPASSGQAKP